mmetsp:Transcript_5270/g.6067  ORF Transcript_5270/g.6067 Transcript_5270/m.6067 type:complete len:80 (+) Transcript_5270:92-331(+)
MNQITRVLTLEVHKPLSPQTISYEPNEIAAPDSPVIDGPTAKNIVFPQLLEPLDYRQDWSQEILYTFATLTPQISFDSG